MSMKGDDIMRKQKIQVNISDDMLNRIDTVCEALGLSRSSFCLLLIRSALPSWEIQSSEYNLDRLAQLVKLFPDNFKRGD